MSLDHVRRRAVRDFRQLAAVVLLEVVGDRLVVQLQVVLVAHVDDELLLHLREDQIIIFVGDAVDDLGPARTPAGDSCQSRRPDADAALDELLALDLQRDVVVHVVDAAL